MRDTGAEISLNVTPAGPVDLSPSGTVISFLVPERKFDLDVVQSFCDYVHFFASPHAAERWTAQHPATFALGVRTPSQKRKLSLGGTPKIFSAWGQVTQAGPAGRGAD